MFHIKILLFILLFLSYFFARALITKYTLPYFSMTPPTLLTLFKKYLLIMLIILIPAILIYFFTILIIFTKEPFSEHSLFEYILLITYFFELFLITKIIKDKNNLKIPIKVAFVLIVLFFLSDMIIGEISIYAEDTYFPDTITTLNLDNKGVKT